jgi:gamma-glutamyl:cysteine ligase YbdK (ATP-grasp superfamily)
LYHLFERFGIELEYMIVDKDTLGVSPLTDKVLQTIYGKITNEVVVGDIAWSNELALHVIEAKTANPAYSIIGLDKKFHESIQKINGILIPYNACLMGGPMHPFMDPVKEIRLWPHDYSPIYHAFDRIFSCKGHGWANLQSMHINLPFANDEEFGRLHAAIRLILPLIPALSAGSPIADGKLSGFHDTRMETYRSNSKKIPSITGQVIPEAVFTQAHYEEKILQQIYRDLDPYDPEKILQEEWVNARGAIARFERNTIEIRVIDVQETPFADQAIAAAVIDSVRMLAEEEFSTFETQKKVLMEPLVATFLDIIKTGESAIISDSSYLEALGLSSGRFSATEIWKQIIQKSFKRKQFLSANFSRPLEIILNEGTLSSRILRNAGPDPSRAVIRDIYHKMCDCLSDGIMFL